jgi:ribosomal protein L14
MSQSNELSDVSNQKLVRRAVLLELQEENRRGDGVWVALAVAAMVLVALTMFA